MSEVSEEEVERAVVTLDISQLADRQTWTELCRMVDIVTAGRIAPPSFYNTNNPNYSFPL